MTTSQPSTAPEKTAKVSTVQENSVQENKDIAEQPEPSTSLLSREETREILTPFAFEIDKSLFGLKLANPWSRGLALTIDGIAIAMLSTAPGELLAFVFAITAFKLSSNKRAQQMGKAKGRKRRAIMRFIAAFVLFVVLIDVLPKVLNQFGSNSSTNSNIVTVGGKDVSKTDAAIFLAETIKFSTSIDDYNCDTYTCWYKAASPVVDSVKPLDIPADKLKEGITELAAETNLSTKDKNLLATELMARLEPSSNVETDNKPAKQANQSDQTAKTKQDDNFSIFEFIKKFVDEMGIGFGWAALYFTVLTAVWKGQTIGKKIAGIRVIQLDGTPLSIWDSFGRYGGYGAGLATGLLGFAQIFWDANRQAIHDKISATVVIDVKKNAEK